MFTDNDELSGLMAQMTNARTLVLLSNIDGIYTGNPNDRESRLIASVTPDDDLSKYIMTEKSSAGRGGMESKYNTARTVAKSGIRVIIANGNRDNILPDVLTQPDRVPHTVFLPARQ